jgi:ATP-binding cassette subfamily B protein
VNRAAEQSDDLLGKAYDARLVGRLWPYIRRQRGWLAIAAVVLGLLLGVQLVQPWLIKRAIDEQIATSRVEGLGALVAAYVLLLIAEFGLRFAQILCLERAGQGVIHHLRVDCFAHLQRVPAAFFDRNPIGRLITHLTSDAEALNEAFTSGLVMILADLVKLIAIAVILLQLSPRLAVAAFAIMPIMITASVAVRTRLRRAYREIRSRLSELNAALQEHLAGVRVVQQFLRERSVEAQFQQRNRAHRDAELKGVFYDSAFSALTELIGALTLASLVFVGGHEVIGQALTLGTLVAFFEYANRFFTPLQELSQRYAVMQAAMVAAERLFRLLDSPVAVDAGRVEFGSRARGQIVFRDVSLRYESGAWALDRLNLEIAAREKVAVVGWTGSGKTSLIRLLVRLYEPSQGTIELDGVDLRAIPLATLRRQIGVVLQDNYLFEGTIATNISMGDPSIGRKQIERAAEVVGLSGLLARFPGGLDQEIGLYGQKLSVGEKQLVCFARALAFDPPILILDEATSSVDPETERRLTRAVARLLDGRTAIVVAHRLETIRYVDRILVLHRGALVQSGTAQALATDSEGLYAALHRLQFGLGGAAQ